MCYRDYYDRYCYRDYDWEYDNPYYYYRHHRHHRYYYDDFWFNPYNRYR